MQLIELTRYSQDAESVWVNPEYIIKLEKHQNGVTAVYIEGMSFSFPMLVVDSVRDIISRLNTTA